MCMQCVVVWAQKCGLHAASSYMVDLELNLFEDIFFCAQALPYFCHIYAVIRLTLHIFCRKSVLAAHNKLPSVVVCVIV